MSGNYKIATVRWVDSVSAPGWGSDVDASLCECETTGYMLHCDKTAVVIALNRSVTAGIKPFGDTITIPRVAVTSIKYVSPRSQKAIADGSKQFRKVLKRLARK